MGNGGGLMQSGGLFDAGVGVIAANRQKKAAAQTKKDAQKNRQQGLDFVSGMDWEPELLSDYVPTYQRSQSPVADAFLMSLITGDNPATIQGTRNGAGALRNATQARFDANTGGYDALRARQREMEASVPWAPKQQFTEPAVSQEDLWRIQSPGLARNGISRGQSEALRGVGVELDPVTATNTSARMTGAAGGGFLGNQNAWGVQTDPAYQRRIAEAVQAGDMALADRIMRGLA